MLSFDNYNHIKIKQKTLYIERRTTVWLVSSLTILELTKEENILLFVCRYGSSESNLAFTDSKTKVLLCFFTRWSYIKGKILISQVLYIQIFFCLIGDQPGSECFPNSASVLTRFIESPHQLSLFHVTHLDGRHLIDRILD